MLKDKEINQKQNFNNHNIIASGTKIEGDITTDSDIRIEGELFGNIESSGKVIVGISGTINGNIKSKNVDIAGKITGDVEVEEIFSMKSTSFFQGNVLTNIISIEPNAQFVGNCKMKPNLQ